MTSLGLRTLIANARALMARACAGGFSRAYLRHLLMAREILGPVLLTLHNLTFVQRLLAAARDAIAAGSLHDLRARIRAAWRGAPPEWSDTPLGLPRLQEKAMSTTSLSEIWISPEQAALLQVLLRLVRARQEVEVVTLGGYSAIAMGRLAGLVENGMSAGAAARFLGTARRRTREWRAGCRTGLKAH